MLWFASDFKHEARAPSVGGPPPLGSLKSDGIASREPQSSHDLSPERRQLNFPRLRFSSFRMSVPLALLIFVTFLQARAAESKFSASLDRDSIVLGETATLTMAFEGGSPRGLPAIPQVPGLQMAGGGSSFNSSVVINGAMTSSQSYSITLVPERAGEFVIPPITADMDGQRVQSQPLKLKVMASDPSAPPPEFGDKLAFLWLVLPKKELYVGEVLVAELRLYVRGDALKIADAQVPPLGGEGFTSSKFVETGNYKRRIGNSAFMVVPITAAVTPVKTGKLNLGPLAGSVTVYVPGSRQRLDPFDIFGPQAEPRRVSLTLDAQEVTVSPLPSQGVPPGFNGAVGNYTMTYTAGPTNVAAGDPITVKVQISGRGHLDALTLPDQPGWQDFKAYPATTKLDTTDKLGIEGTKFFEQVIVPQSSDIKQLPPFAFSFFDPDQNKYRTLSQAAVPILVRPGGTVTAPVAATNSKQKEEPPVSHDIVQNKQRLGVLAQARPLLLEQPWFVAAQTMPLAAWIAALLWRKRRDAFANNPRLRRKQQVEGILRDGFAQLRRAASANQSDAFFATLFRLLQEQLGERLDLPASAITEAVIDDELRPRNVTDSIIAQLHEIFQMCNLARYAPIKSSQELTAIIPKFEALVKDLKAIKS